jgi:hypothetical protein
MTRPLPFPSALRQAALLAALYAVAGSCLTLAGWILDVPSLSDWGHTGIAMQPNTAVGALLCSVSLLLAVFNRRWASDALAHGLCDRTGDPL